MTLPKYTVEYIGHIYENGIGPIMHVTLTYVKKRWFWFKKKVIRNNYYWRPARALLSKETIKYTEYGNNKHILGNVWFKVISDDTTPEFVNNYPDISLLRYYRMRRLPVKSKLSQELTKFYSLHLFDYIFKPN